MHRLFSTLLLGAFGISLTFAAGPSHSTLAQALDSDLKSIEGELVPLVEAMPADKFDFAPSPSQGAFKGVRTFRLQATHIATVIYEVSASVLGEANPVSLGEHENGAASIKSKEDVVKYLKAAFVYGHKAMNSITEKNATELIKAPFGNQSMPRLNLATIPAWHSFDHYGQMVVYARMNGIVPPASR